MHIQKQIQHKTVTAYFNQDILSISQLIKFFSRLNKNLSQTDSDFSAIFLCKLKHDPSCHGGYERRIYLCFLVSLFCRSDPSIIQLTRTRAKRRKLRQKLETVIGLCKVGTFSFHSLMFYFICCFLFLSLGLH